jgi:hypothetical protein
MFEISVLSSSGSCYVRNFRSYFACFISSMYISNWLYLSTISIDHVACMSLYVLGQEKVICIAREKYMHEKKIIQIK